MSLAMKLDENIFLWFDADSEFLCTADSASIITISARLFLLFICSTRMLTATSNGPQIVFMSDVSGIRCDWHDIIEDEETSYLSLSKIDWVNIWAICCVAYIIRIPNLTLSRTNKSKNSRPKHFIIYDKIFMSFSESFPL